jgi:hypothetical protein
MNKWQIICPLILMLIIAAWAYHTHTEGHVKALNTAIKRHLELVLEELEAHQSGGQFPPVEIASRILNDPDITRRVHVTSLFETRDLWYNPSRPSVRSDADIVCAHIRNNFYAIRPDHRIHGISEKDLRRGGFVPLASPATDLAIESDTTSPPTFLPTDTNFIFPKPVMTNSP